MNSENQKTKERRDLNRVRCVMALSFQIQALIILQWTYFYIKLITKTCIFTSTKVLHATLKRKRDYYFFLTDTWNNGQIIFTTQNTNAIPPNSD